MMWFGNIVKIRKKHFLNQSNIVKTIQVDLMFRINEENINPLFCRELYIHSPIKWSVSINFDLQFHVTNFQATYLILNIYQKQTGRKRSAGRKDP